MADVALVRLLRGVPGLAGCLVLSAALPANEFLGDAAIWISLADHLEDLVAVEVGPVGAGASLDVVHQTRGRDEGSSAEGTGDLGAAVDARVQVLRTEGLTVYQRGLVGFGEIDVLGLTILRSCWLLNSRSQGRQ